MGERQPTADAELPASLQKSTLVEHDTHSLANELRSAGFPASHAKPVLRHFYAHCGQPTQWPTEIGVRLANYLASPNSNPASRVQTRQVSPDGTTKLLLQLADGKAIETVLMPAHRPDRAAGCVSSQVGCAMGCAFCASTRNGLLRNLTVAEIVEQYLHLKREAASLNRRITSLVFMGMGEPMHNLENVLAAIVRIADPDLGGLGWRQITVSTVGIVPGIDALADADLNVHLALSLHAPDDATRSKLIPANQRYPVADILAATKRFYDRTRRICTIEYCLLHQVNDTPEQAKQLAALLAGFKAHVNLIPFNAIPGSTFAPPTIPTLRQFQQILRDAGVVTHVRQQRGEAIDAACGQLAGNALQAKAE